MIARVTQAVKAFSSKLVSGSTKLKYNNCIQR